MSGTLRLVLGDQLSRAISSLDGLDRAQDVVLMAEVTAEATYVPHHKQKLAFVFSAMRHFADALRADGIRVDYVPLDAAGDSGSLEGEVGRAIARHGPGRLIVTEPGEWRLWDAMQGWEARLGLPLEIREDRRFLCSRADFARWARGRRQLRMEWFYREMRRRHGILMDGERPAGGRWNLDAENRRPPSEGLDPPRPLRLPPDATTGAVLDLVRRRFADDFGDLEPFEMAVAAADAERAFARFVEQALPRFGDYQDAMLDGEDTLFHAAISPQLNAGLLDPLSICRRVEAAWRDGRVPLNAAEGFIRQILGWREFVRGLYWLEMPGYARTNALGAERPIPAFYWDGASDMHCLKTVVGQARRRAYAHHIQRLMVTGNFALLAGIRPEDVHLWYMVVFADAYEWVELPNTHGMALFAGGGRLASKPYAASGAYIARMSDYCRHCRYDVRARTGADACPFNYLYWDFVLRNRERLQDNPRLAMVMRTLERMDAGRIAAVRDDAARFLESLEPWRPGREVAA